MQKTTLSVLGAFAVATGSAQAAIVAQYDLTAITDPNEATETFLSGSVDGNGDSVASDLTSPATHNSGVVHPEFGDPQNNGGDQAIGFSARGNNPSQTFSIVNPIDTYFSFDVTPTGGQSFTYGTLSVETGVFKSINGTTAYDYTLSYSTDGSSYTALGTVAAGAGAGQAATIAVNGTATAVISFDLSTIGTQAGTVYFQLDPVASAGASQNGVQSQRAGFIDDLSVDVTVIPEPASAALAGLGALLIAGRRRRA